MNRAWQAFLRRFDIEHTFRFFKQVLGWTRPKLRDPAAADRWTWIVIACYAQLCLARPLAADIRLPWQRPCPPGRLTPARVRRGFRNIRQALPDLASAPKPGKPGPGRPPGSKNRHPATRHDVGKTVKRDQPKKKTRRQKGLNNKLRPLARQGRDQDQQGRPLLGGRDGRPKLSPALPRRQESVQSVTARCGLAAMNEEEPPRGHLRVIARCARAPGTARPALRRRPPSRSARRGPSGRFRWRRCHRGVRARFSLSWQCALLRCRVCAAVVNRSRAG